MFKDARARRAWRLYFLRAEAALSPLASSVRRELLDDLKAHAREILANDKSGADELARVEAALTRIGDPAAFLGPLVAEAVFRAPPQPSGLAMTYRTLSLYAGRGLGYLMTVVGLLTAGTMGIIIAAAAFNSLLRPDRAGLFRIGADEYQVRVLGFSPGAGEQLLTPWLAVLLMVTGAAMIAWAVWRARRMLLELLAAKG